MKHKITERRKEKVLRQKTRRKRREGSKSEGENKITKHEENEETHKVETSRGNERET